KQAIDDAAVAKKAEIDGRDDLTKEEKDAAKFEVDAEATKAKDAVDTAKTDADVTAAKDSGVDAIKAENPTPVAKPAAKQAIDDAAATKKAEIDGRDDLTKEEKDAAKAKVDAEATKAKDAVDTAKTDADVTTAKDSGVDAIKAENPDAVAKEVAKAAIDEAAQAKKSEIDARPDLTDEEKSTAKSDVDTKADQAKQAIDAATTNDGVTSAKDAGVSDIKSVTPEPVAKEAAKAAIDDAAAAKKAEIDGRDDLTNEEKSAAKSEVDAEATKAKNAVDAAKTDADVTAAKDSGADAIKAENPSPVAKPVAKQAIDDAAATKKAEIDGRDDLTKEEKDAAKAKVDAEAIKAKDAVDAAKTDADVTAAKDSGVDAIKAENPSPVAKPAAKQAIDDAAAAKKAEIDGRDDLTKEEKDAAKAKVDAEATKAKDAVEAAKTDADVTAVKNSGVDAIKAENPDAVAKPAAKQAIDDAAATKKAEIDGRDDLTKEEKDATKAKVDAEAIKAKDAVDAAKTDADVAAAKDSGVDAIKAENPSPVAKGAAKAAIDEAAQAKKSEIDARPDLTDEEKATAKSDVDSKATDAKKAIDAATTNDGVTSAKDAGVSDINSVNPSPVAKDAAKKTIDEAAQAKKSEIDARPDLTDEEKAAAKSEVDSKVTVAKKAVDDATTNDAVSSAKDAGVTDINSVNPSPVAKKAAKAAIDEAAQAKKDEIDGRTDLTDEEKSTAKSEVDSKATDAKKAIDLATTNAGVTSSKDAGVKDINSVNPSPVAKDAAKQAIDDAAATKKAEIDGRDDLTKEEKDAAKAKVDGEATKAKNAVDAAKTDADVTAAKDSGVDAIKAENPSPVAKGAAKAAIDEAAQAKKSEIDARPDLTDEEKATAKSDVDSKATDAKKAIDAATTNDGVTSAKDAGVSDINSVNPSPVAKDAAKKTIDEAAQAKKDEIDARTDLTDEEKSTAKSEVDSKAVQAKQAIDAATTNDGVTFAKDAGATDINSVNPSPVAKNAAKKAIDDAAAAKKAEIDGRDDLTNEEKSAAKSEVDAEATKAKDAVDAAKTDADVTAAKDSGVDAIKAENPSPVAKPVAKQAIDDAAAAKKAEIDGRSDLTDEEKATAKSEVDTKATVAKKAVDDATTNDAVSSAKDTGVTDINSVNPSPVAKDEAKKAINDAAQAKKSEIDARPDLTDEEKSTAKSEVDSKATDAKKAIDNATTNAGVSSSKDAGVTNINSVNPSPVAKEAAKAAIDEAAQAK
ncbi:DUF1542 domain-containing protein, partial [Streptococcus sp. NLN64]|uniref:DUF1542 domain-containing protein n=1 Tax=Streptococcus sp. NLN64 TaxID=2822799 RepID=UPI0018C8D960